MKREWKSVRVTKDDLAAAVLAIDLVLESTGPLRQLMTSMEQLQAAGAVDRMRKALHGTDQQEGPNLLLTHLTMNYEWANLGPIDRLKLAEKVLAEHAEQRVASQ